MRAALEITSESAPVLASLTNDKVAFGMRPLQPANAGETSKPRVILIAQIASPGGRDVQGWQKQRRRHSFTKEVIRWPVACENGSSNINIWYTLSSRCCPAVRSYTSRQYLPIIHGHTMFSTNWVLPLLLPRLSH